MPVPPACNGIHEGFETPREKGDRFGVTDREIDGPAMGALIAAAQDCCMPCQQRQLDTLQGDPLTTARLVELAAGGVQGVAGGIPDGMTTETGPTTFTAPFRTLVRIGCSRIILPADVDVELDRRPMYAAAAAMTDAERRQALDDAVDMLIGVMNWPGHRR